MSASTASDIEGFLQDVIGREQVLKPRSGRLREIHARIAKEVEDVEVRPLPTEQIMTRLTISFGNEERSP